jgi:hypothetical protein
MSWFLVRAAGLGNGLGHGIIHTLYLNQDQTRSSGVFTCLHEPSKKKTKHL